MRALGLDLSLTSTGVAHPDGTVERLAPRVTGMERLAWFRAAIVERVELVDVVAVEGYAMGSKRQSHSYATGELGGVIRLALHDSGVTFVEIPPALLKKYATGRGNGTKDEVLVAAVKRLSYDGANNDEADALWLRAMALHHYDERVVDVPQIHAAALDKVVWPALSAKAA